MTSLATNQRNTGALLVVLSAVVFSTAGIFTKSVTADAWQVIFWRGLTAAAFTLFYLLLRGRLGSEIRAFGIPALLVVGLGAAGSAAFVTSFKLTSVANVALIYGAAPFLAAGLSWALTRERPTRTVMIASVAGFSGVALIVSGSLGGGTLAGDALALFMTAMLAGIMVIYRRFPATTAALPAALSSIVLLPIAARFSDPMQTVLAEIPTLAAFGLVFAVASVTLSEGARRLPAAETALLSTLELPLAPVLALIILSEAPPLTTVAGGLIVLISVVWSQRRTSNVATTRSHTSATKTPPNGPISAVSLRATRERDDNDSKSKD
ncbi:DMT family transporter [Sulfitobacter aestuariivivens]|uniref:EamA family transporter n=1 Tax=Sulfitobacter aestuariivivens TaxID=2766981 RepID=A0A927D7X8_9RHOB|nr:DMT family transporter [Sulfitobacter aestuariivivens]MBD3664411.1 EamA family transporter [Sulfitobacter aestuariivivens]